MQLYTKLRLSTRKVAKNFYRQSAIRQCIQTGGDIKQVAKEREIKFAMPL